MSCDSSFEVDSDGTLVVQVRLLWGPSRRMLEKKYEKKEKEGDKGEGWGVRGEGMIWNGRRKEERSANKIHALIIYKEQNTSRPLSNQFSLNT